MATWCQLINYLDSLNRSEDEPIVTRPARYDWRERRFGEMAEENSSESHQYSNDADFPFEAPPVEVETPFLSQTLALPDYDRILQGAIKFYHYLNTPDNGTRPVYRPFLTRNLSYMKMKVTDDEADYFPSRPPLVANFMGLKRLENEIKQYEEKSEENKETGTSGADEQIQQKDEEKSEEKEPKEDVEQKKEAKPLKKWRIRCQKLHSVLEKIAEKASRAEVNTSERQHDSSILPIVGEQNVDGTDEKEGLLAGVIVKILSYELVEKKHEADNTTVYIETEEDNEEKNIPFDDSSSSMTETCSVSSEDDEGEMEEKMRDVADMNLEESDSQTETSSVDSRSTIEDPPAVHPDYETIARVMKCKMEDLVNYPKVLTYVHKRLSLRLPEKLVYHISRGTQNKDANNKKSKEKPKGLKISTRSNVSRCPICQKSFDNMFILLLHMNTNYPMLTFVLDIGSLKELKKKRNLDEMPVAIQIYLNPYYDGDIEFRQLTQPVQLRQTDPVFLMNKFTKKEMFKHLKADMTAFLDTDNSYSMADHLFSTGSYCYITMKDLMKKDLAEKWLESVEDKEYPPPGYEVALEKLKRDFMSTDFVGVPYTTRRFMVMWNDMRIRLGNRFCDYMGAYMSCRLFMAVHWKFFLDMEFVQVAIDTMRNLAVHGRLSWDDFVDLHDRMILIRLYRRLKECDPLYLQRGPLWNAFDERLTEMREIYKQKLEKKKEKEDTDLNVFITLDKEAVIPSFVRKLGARILTKEEKTALFVAEYDNEDFLDIWDTRREYRANPIEKFFDGEMPDILIEAARDAPFYLPDIYGEVKHLSPEEEKQAEEWYAATDRRKFYDKVFEYMERSTLEIERRRSNEQQKAERFLEELIKKRLSEENRLSISPPLDDDDAHVPKRQKIIKSQDTQETMPEMHTVPESTVNSSSPNNSNMRVVKQIRGSAEFED